ncbi:MAG: enoyl-CoA hydratase, partial [Rhodocyclales bacterium CG_4_10_14_3_um_filter_68_10]
MDPVRPATLSQFIENRTYEEIRVGDAAMLTRTLRPEDIQLFAIMSGDVNPAHVDPEYAASSLFREVIAHGMWGGALISTVLGTQFPGPGTIYIDQTLHFSRPVVIGDTITVTVTCKQKFDHNHHILFDCLCVNQDGLKVIRGTAEVLAPTEKIRRPRKALPALIVADRELRYRHLIERAKGIESIPMAVVHPCDAEALKGALAARDEDLVVPILVGPERRIRALAEELMLDLAGCSLIDAPHSHAAAAMAVQLARSGQAEAIMKGSLHTDELMAEVVATQTGLRTERRISHVFLMDVPTYPRLLMITDAAVNIEPSLEDKVDIVQNAIDLAHILAIPEPKVAILAAVETVTS